MTKVAEMLGITAVQDWKKETSILNVQALKIKASSSDLIKDESNTSKLMIGGCRKYLCSLCPISFKLKSHLKRHVSTQHKADHLKLTHVDLQIDDNAGKPQDDFFICEFCDKTLKPEAV